MRQNKKRDRTGEKYGQYMIICPTEKDGEWIARCSCGRERIVKNDNIWKLNRCKSCAAKLRMKKQKPKKDKFTEMQNWMRPKRPKFKYDVLYELDYYQCTHSCKGTLINEYRNTASFEVVECNSIDEKVVAKLNRRVNLKKKDVYDLCPKN
ncbi:hypothetical protein P7H46_12200 [Enterococcus pseudoavium]|uniref:AP2 domain-containing protein n=1 Tax=Enterococcus pseudoavium TaxID=44007 RepID=A0ABU3FMF8_9ENTE|nr:hypothetical protein [Enterococcus pseudoavium]MDT2771581.1 hypothetical protein [Enterococcus pseudoavium]